MSLVSWIIFGIITGFLSHRTESNSGVEHTLAGAVLLGIVGAILGGVLANLLLGMEITTFSLSSLLIAIVSSLLLLFINRTLPKT